MKGLDEMSSVKYQNRELKLKPRRCVIELRNCVFVKASRSDRC